MDDLLKQLRENIAPSLADCIEAADRIKALEAQLAKADALVTKGNTLALRLTHIVGKEDVVTAWEQAEAEYRAAREKAQ